MPKREKYSFSYGSIYCLICLSHSFTYSEYSGDKKLFRISKNNANVKINISNINLFKEETPFLINN